MVMLVIKKASKPLKVRYISTSQGPSRSKLVVMLLFGFSIGCNSSDQLDNRFQPSTTGPATEQGAPSSTSKKVAEKILSYKDEAGQSTLAQIAVNPAALADNQTFSVTASYHTDVNDLAAELNLAADNTITPTTVATVVSSNEPLKEPITILMNLPPQPTGLLGLWWLGRNYFVVGTTYNQKTKKWEREVVPEKNIAVKGDKLAVKTDKLGRHEIWESKKPIGHNLKPRPVQKPDFKYGPVAITKVKPIVAGTGQRVTLKGKYFGRATRITVAGIPVRELTIEDKATLSFAMPATPFGKAAILARQGQNRAEGTIMALGDKTDLPYIALAEDQICIGTVYYDSRGLRKSGTKTCELSACISSNEVGCLTTESIPALATSTIQANMLLNSTQLNGVRGRLVPPKPLPPSCDETRATSCITTERFVAVARDQMKPNSFRKGVSFPSIGVFGTFPSQFGDLAGQSSVFNLDQGNFASALSNTSGIPFQYWDSAGQRHILTGDTALAADNLREQLTVYGIKGVAKEGNLPRCLFVGDANCRALSDGYWAIAKKTLSPRNIRTGATIGNVVGKYPSEAYPLEGSQPSSVRASDLDTLLSSTQSMVVYDRFGGPHTLRGSQTLNPKSIREGVNVFGITGAVKPLDVASLVPANIRAGVTVEGVTGTMKVNCRNLGPSRDDTVSDVYKPSNNPWGTNNHTCNKGNWLDVTSNPDGSGQGCTRGSPHCMFKNKLTGLAFGGNSGKRKAAQSWMGAFCEGKSRYMPGPFGGHSDWQPPTVDELTEAYIHGLAYFLSGDPHFVEYRTKGEVWTKSGLIGASGYGYSFKTDRGLIKDTSSSQEHAAYCVRNAN